MSPASPYAEKQISSLTGFGGTLFMYGISLCQHCVYFSTYPNDNIFQKYLVALLWVANTLQLYCMICMQWMFHLSVRHDVHPTPFPFIWQTNVDMVLMFVIPFIVQCFYGWRLWIMSDGNLLVTICVILLSAAQCVSGVAFTFGLRLPTNYLRALFSVTTVICDILITASVWYYLRTSRLKRTRTAIQRIVTVTMHMGAFTSLIALWVWVMWVTQGAIPQILTPLMMTSQTYVNSILAVLNARTPDSQESQNLDKPQSSIELPTLSIP